MSAIPAISRNLADLSDELGFVPAILLSGAYGGLNIYVPRNMHRAHALARLFEAGGAGFGAAMTLSELYGDTTLSVPKLYAYERLRQCAEVNNLIACGMDEQDAARALGLKLRTFRKRLHEARAIGLSSRKLRDRLRLRRLPIAAQSDPAPERLKKPNPTQANNWTLF